MPEDLSLLDRPKIGCKTEDDKIPMFGTVKKNGNKIANSERKA